jgi:uncharacterized MAPEG superfamily protein
MRWLKIWVLIATIFLCLVMARDTHSQYAHHSLRMVDQKYWQLDLQNRTGYTTRIKATQQNPYPFCFATGAAMLFDQQRCQTNRRDCTNATATSFLHAVAAGQSSKTLNTDAGGNAVASLRHLTETGYVEHKDCNYNHLDSSSPNFTQQAVNMLHQYDAARRAEASWNTHKNYAPYLERLYRSQWNKALRTINPQLTDTQTQEWLGRVASKPELMSLVLLNTCTKSVRKDNRFRVAYKTNALPEENYQLIESLLRKNKAVLVNFCVNAKTNDECIGNNKHAAIIVAQTKVTHRGTGDQRTAYWIVNSWGETWQEKNTDGWIFADSFLESVFAEIIWLDQK